MTKLRNSLILAAASALLCLPTSAAADTTVKADLSGAERQWRERQRRP